MADVLIDVDTSTIEHLDFVPTLACEHSQHESKHEEEPAAWAQWTKCPVCGGEDLILICDSGRARLLSMPGIRHSQGCGIATQSEAWGVRFTPIEEVQ